MDPSEPPHSCSSDQSHQHGFCLIVERVTGDDLIQNSSPILSVPILSVPLFFLPMLLLPILLLPMLLLPILFLPILLLKERGFSHRRDGEGHGFSRAVKFARRFGL